MAKSDALRDDGGKGATVAQLKADIDSGRTGDKVSGFDPAASPLGTDDEAGGTPPSREVIAEARQAERRNLRKDVDQSSRPELSAAPDGRPPKGAIWTPALLGGVVVGALVALAIVLSGR